MIDYKYALGSSLLDASNQARTGRYLIKGAALAMLLLLLTGLQL